jgi:2-polyprenyl-3-methyl-5-hydroxy-6-metoxy-1,4-benzoquinol methylase
MYPAAHHQPCANLSLSEQEEAMQRGKPDYIAVHAPAYRRIAAGERAGWSEPADVAAALGALKRCLALTGAPTGGELLELGCGDGCLSVELARLPGFAVAGIDIVPLAIELAAQRAAREGVALDLHLGDVLSLPFDTGRFDVVVDGHCLHCIVYGDRARFLAEALRVLRPGGMLVVLTMAGDPPPEELPGEFDAATRTQVYRGIAGRHFGLPEGIIGEVQAAGFTVCEHWLEPDRDAVQGMDELTIAAVKPER